MNYRIILNLLGNLCIAFSIVVILPIIAALFYHPNSLPVFVGIMALSSFIAFLGKSYGQSDNKQRICVREAVLVVALGWLLICTMGAIPYYLIADYDLVTALFESFSGFTTTGVTTIDSFNEIPTPIKVWRCLTQWCGGIGVIMLFIVIMPRMNSGASHLFNAELPSGMKNRTMTQIKESAKFIAVIYIGLTIFDFLLLLLVGIDVYQALNIASETVSTGGFSFSKDSLKSLNSVYAEMITVAFMLVASVNYGLYYKIWRKDWSAIKEEPEYRYYFGLLFAAFFMISTNLYLSGYTDFLSSLRLGIFQTVSIGSTTGFATDSYEGWPSLSRYVLFLLMFVGGCSNSTAGGIKISRMVILLKACWAELLRTIHPRLVYTIRFGKSIVEPEIVGNISRFFFLYIFIFVILTVLISLSGLSLMNSMGLIAALLSSIGPAFSFVDSSMNYSEISTYGRIICILAMLLGRLEFFTILVLFQPDFWKVKKNW